MDSGALYGAVVVLAVIGGLELFDRTSFALIALAARARPMPTWAGGASAFVVTSALAVSVGAGIIALLGPSHLGLIRVVGGAFLIAYALWLLSRPPEPVGGEAPTGVRSAFLTAFATILVLELGDTTMIFEIVFVPDYGWAVVFLAGAAALVAVAAWDVVIGRRLASRLSPRRLRAVVVAVMLAVGLLTIVYGLAAGAVPSMTLIPGA